MLPDSITPAYSYAGPPPRERDGTNPIEQKAVYRTQLEVRSMPASLVVQIALWPDKLADWAKETAISPAVVYNMLAGVKPYHRVRRLLARRLNVTKQQLDHLIDAPRPEPLAKVPPDPPPDALQATAVARAGKSSGEEPDAPFRWQGRAGPAAARGITGPGRSTRRRGGQSEARPPGEKVGGAQTVLGL